MDKDDLENNLGTIASSGSYKFKQEMSEKQDDIDIIGQFGVGFYSAFMVAKKITVVTKKYGCDTAYKWESDGADGYEITETERDEIGTTIVLKIKDNTEEENYDEFLEQYRIQGLIKKYSDYIRYPIMMDMTHSRVKEETKDSENRSMRIIQKPKLLTVCSQSGKEQRKMLSRKSTIIFIVKSLWLWTSLCIQS